MSVSQKNSRILWVLLSALVVWGIGQTPPGAMVRDWVARGADFKAREIVAPGRIDPRIKIFAFDDATVARLKGTDITLKNWGDVVASIASKRPRLIMIDKLFDRHYAPGEIREFSARLKSLAVPVSIIVFASRTPIPGREELQFPGDPGSLARSDSRHLYGADQSIVDATRIGHAVYEGGGYVTPAIKLVDGKDLPHWSLSAAQSLDIDSKEIRVDGKSIPLDGSGKVLVNLHPAEVYARSAFSFLPLVAGAMNQVSPESVEAGDFVVILPAMYTGSTDWTTTVLGEMPGGYLMVAMVDSVLTGTWLTTVGDSLLGCLIFALLGAAAGHWSPYNRVLILAASGSFGIAALGIAAFCWANYSLPWSSWILAWNLPCLGIMVMRFQASRVESARMSTELVAASLVQTAYLPKETTPKHLRVVPFYKPSAECGGDWWWFKSLSETSHYFLLGDVTGHGVGAALVTSSIFAAVESHCDFVAAADSPPAPESFLKHVDQILSRTHGRISTVTMVAGRLDLARRELTLSYGGHPSAFMVSKASGKGVERVGGRGDVLGMGETVEFPSVTVPLNVGDRFVLYTDGVTDNRDRKGKRRDRLALVETLKTHIDQSAATLVSALVDAYLAHIGNQPGEDDATILAIEVTSLPPPCP